MIIVAHGSRSPRWVGAQRDWFDGVRRELGPLGMQVELTFLEISLPLFEDRLLALAGNLEGPLAIMPLFLAKGGHAGEDVPRIADAVLGRDGWRLVPPAGWIHHLGDNAARRLRACGTAVGDPVIVSGYGSSHDENDWLDLVRDIQAHAGEYAAGPAWEFAPSGHFLADSAEPLRGALRRVAGQGLQNPAILPLYLAVSSYQESLIPQVISEFPGLAIRFEPTAILPDGDLERWGAEVVRAALSKSSEQSS
jgi:sirohydrochlorin ferrochelatase